MDGDTHYSFRRELQGKRDSPRKVAQEMVGTATAALAAAVTPALDQDGDTRPRQAQREAGYCFPERPSSWRPTETKTHVHAMRIHLLNFEASKARGFARRASIFSIS